MLESLSLPAILFLKFLMNWPMPLPNSGKRFGPKTKTTTATINAISQGPSRNINTP